MTAVDRKTEALLRFRDVARRQIERLPPEERAAAQERHRARNRIMFDYPDTGPLRREVYVDHMRFFSSGKEDDERAFITANRIGKSYAAANEVSYHMTGLYPRWWEGRRFSKPTTWWAANESWKRVRDINQLELLGIPDREDLRGTGSIPAHLLLKTVPNPHIKFGMESFHARHITGGVSSCQFKTYEQGWKEFEGVRIHGGIWLDEHCPLDIYGSCQMRVANTDGPEGSRDNGIIMLTFTPIGGLTPIIQQLKERAVNKDELCW